MCKRNNLILLTWRVVCGKLLLNPVYLPLPHLRTKFQRFVRLETSGLQFNAESVM
jgi:hypothetical protein